MKHRILKHICRVKIFVFSLCFFFVSRLGLEEGEEGGREGREGFFFRFLSHFIFSHFIFSRNNNMQTCPDEKNCDLVENGPCDNESTDSDDSGLATRTLSEEKKPFDCKFCGYRCSWKSAMTIHLRTHTGEKPFECAICSYRCSDKSNLTAHQRTHTGEKPFVCAICDMRFSRNSDMTRHQRTHTGEKPFECTICGYRCSLKSHLSTHQRTHTREKTKILEKKKFF